MSLKIFVFISIIYLENVSIREKRNTLSISYPSIASQNIYNIPERVLSTLCLTTTEAPLAHLLKLQKWLSITHVSLQ